MKILIIKQDLKKYRTKKEQKRTEKRERKMKSRFTNNKNI